MDFGLISAAATAITSAVDLGRAAIGVRDANVAVLEISKINDQLLKAQEAILRHNTELLALQQQHFETAQQLREAQEALEERGRYSLVQIARGQWAYRVNITPELSGASKPTQAQTPHYVCQQCFDRGVKAVLQFSDGMGYGQLTCHTCRVSLACTLTRI